ncbi:hypothetical protein PTSG_09093 [Salpingoeca rosetta]|uniref:Uncharacterized protein n=1 Tax=Salpingoeca rosetta (strain ATCC 50818 / BSB-021) TaxID=946362 RepID=F2UM69_SALR5|nr:uncharacterized protein PTSG_09093 [Salpingoeca rosetta]EGD78218.1 hypothetical protein PTSG_09093 [Salpingoeca rosetta]|eukprot:XP_004989894.1 hypothetical protein PTSG_09093 [Salpingoeca rosetta]
MLDGTLDCLSNLHFIHIRQLFRVLTTLTFDRQRTAAAGLIDDGLSQSNEELKRIDTIAATTVTHTWLALANDADISIDADMLRCHNASTSTPSDLPVYRGVRFLPSPPAPTTIKSKHIRRDVCTGMARVLGAGTTSARYSTTTPSTRLWFEQTDGPPFETKLQLPSGIAAEFAGMMHSKTDEETRLRKRAAGTRLFTFLMSLQPFVWWDLSLRTGDLNPEEELTVAQVQHESWAHPRLAWACSDDVLFRTVADGQRPQAGDPALRQGCWALCTLINRTCCRCPHTFTC